MRAAFNKGRQYLGRKGDASPCLPTASARAETFRLYVADRSPDSRSSSIRAFPGTPVAVRFRHGYSGGAAPVFHRIPEHLRAHCYNLIPQTTLQKNNTLNVHPVSRRSRDMGRRSPASSKCRGRLRLGGNRNHERQERRRRRAPTQQIPLACHLSRMEPGGMSFARTGRPAGEARKQALSIRKLPFNVLFDNLACIPFA